MEQDFIHLKILLPYQVFMDKVGVKRIVADTHDGSFGILPHRLDCVAALTPGVLVYETQEEGEVFTAIDEGILVKTGLEVLISVRNAIAGKNLEDLRTAVEREFLTLNEQQQNLRSTMAKLETNIVRRLVELQHE